MLNEWSVKTYRSKSLSQLFYQQENLKKQTMYFRFNIYFTKNMSQLVHNEEIKSNDLQTIYHFAKKILASCYPSCPAENSWNI